MGSGAAVEDLQPLILVCVKKLGEKNCDLNGQTKQTAKVIPSDGMSSDGNQMCLWALDI